MIHFSDPLRMIVFLAVQSLVGFVLFRAGVLHELRRRRKDRETASATWDVGDLAEFRADDGAWSRCFRCVSMEAGAASGDADGPLLFYLSMSSPSLPFPIRAFMSTDDAFDVRDQLDAVLMGSWPDEYFARMAGRLAVDPDPSRS